MGHIAQCLVLARSCEVYKIKIIVRSFGSSKNTKLEDGPYCTISGNEPSVTLYKTGSESQTFCCNFKNLHVCSLNQRLKFPKEPNYQNSVKKKYVKKTFSQICYKGVTLSVIE